MKNESGIRYPAITFRGLGSGFTGVGALKASSLLLSMVGSVIVARSLGPGGYGQVAFVLSVLGLAAIPSADAFRPLVIREVARYHSEASWSLLRGLLEWSISKATLVACLLALPVTVWACWRVVGTGASGLPILMLIAVPAIFFWTWSGFVTGALQGLRKVVLAQLFDWLVNPVTYLGIVILLWVTGRLSPSSVLLGALAAMAVSVVAGLITLRVQAPSEIKLVAASRDPTPWLSAWRYFMIIQAVSVANLKVPVVLLGTLDSEIQTGLFRASENIASLMSVSLLIANAVIGPYIAQLHARKDTARLQQLVRGAARAALVLALPVALVVLSYGDWLLELLFGERYIPAYPVLAVLAIGQIISVACGSAGLLLNMTGHEKHLRAPLTIALLLNVALCSVLIPVHGALGAAIAASTSTVTWNVLSLMRAKTLVGVNTAVV